MPRTPIRRYERLERFLLRRLNGQELPQVLLTLGLSFIVADLCLMIWTGDPWQPATPAHLSGTLRVAGLFFPLYRVAVVVVAVPGVDGRNSSHAVPAPFLRKDANGKPEIDYGICVLRFP